MSWNGSGLFNIDSTGQPVSANTLIESADFNALTSDLATGLSNCITKDGQQTVTANLPMANYRHTGVGNASARTDYAAAGQVQDGKLNWVDGGGTADAITATYAPVITALVDGQLCCVRATAANATTTPTFSPNGLTARTIVKKGGAALVAGDIVADGHELILRYDLANTRWELLNPGSYASLGSNTFTGTQKWAKGADVASANALALGADGNYFDITGTTTITSINTVSPGTWVRLQFDASLTLTHHATNLILPTGGNIITSVGDHADFVEYETGHWRCTAYNRYNGNALSNGAFTQDFRLSLTTGLPVTTADVTAATTIYAVPKTGVQISLYDATVVAWITRQSGEFSLALGTLTSGKPYDVFCYSNAGTPTLEALAWTNDTTRATALAYQYGILVKSGDATRRYMGTFYTTSTTTTEDSASKRFLYNYYHRVKRHLLKTDSTASWTYTTGSYRQANNAAANQVEAIQGVAEDAVFIDARNTTSVSASFSSCPVGIGIDSTSASSHTRLSTCSAVSGAASGWSISEYRGVPAAGYHKYVWLETGAANTTFVGGSAGSGISGEVMA